VKEVQVTVEVKEVQVAVVEVKEVQVAVVEVKEVQVAVVEVKEVQVAVEAEMKDSIGFMSRSWSSVFRVEL
jgi:hypothetical protein